jgi:hypothetical protein
MTLGNVLQDEPSHPVPQVPSHSVPPSHSSTPSSVGPASCVGPASRGGSPFSHVGPASRGGSPSSHVGPASRAGPVSSHVTSHTPQRPVFPLPPVSPVLASHRLVVLPSSHHNRFPSRYSHHQSQRRRASLLDPKVSIDAIQAQRREPGKGRGVMRMRRPQLPVQVSIFSFYSERADHHLDAGQHRPSSSPPAFLAMVRSGAAPESGPSKTPSTGAPAPKKTRSKQVAEPHSSMLAADVPMGSPQDGVLAVVTESS